MSMLPRRNSLALKQSSQVYRFSSKDIAKTKRRMSAGEIAADLSECHPILKDSSKSQTVNIEGEQQQSLQAERANDSKSAGSEDSTISYLSSGDEFTSAAASDDELPMVLPKKLVHAESLPVSFEQPIRRRLSICSLRVHRASEQDSIATEELEPITFDRLRKIQEEAEREALEAQKLSAKAISTIDNILSNDVLFYTALFILLCIWTCAVIQILLLVPEQWATATAVAIISITLGTLGGVAYFNPALVDKILQ
eukprot:TRINITY_DN317_c0_g1_i1.p1 TRINITY_DN317_c0_g1~~TRINITY_DN317_c0_g1_i1.p1  ORF type:complete len:254 (+),score=64.42 TRINITY_DN317_c0_g1_i1:224-985(+)